MPSPYPGESLDPPAGEFLDRYAAHLNLAERNPNEADEDYRKRLMDELKLRKVFPTR